MVNVVFKNAYNDCYGTKCYTYKDFEGVEVGDIVAVNTTNGLAIAKVVQTDILSLDCDISNLKTIEKIIKTQKDIQEQQEKERQKQLKLIEIVENARRTALLNELKALNRNTKYINVLDDLSTEELEKLYRMIKQ